jgi:hypothetical protein
MRSSGGVQPAVVGTLAPGANPKPRKDWNLLDNTVVEVDARPEPHGCPAELGAMVLILAIRQLSP